MLAYLSTVDGIEPEQLAGGFFVGWPSAPSPERHLELLRGSYAVELAVDEGRVVGFVSAISDGVLSAYVPLPEVLPGYQHQGIGTELVRRLLAQLDGFYMVDLSCDASLEPFYERLGLQTFDRAMGVRRGENL
jgi:GNAT superfamily N-acetyltransferase